MAVWSKVLPLAGYCLHSMTRLQFRSGLARKLLAIVAKGLGLAEVSPLIPLSSSKQLANHEINAVC